MGDFFNNKDEFRKMWRPNKGHRNRIRTNVGDEHPGSTVWVNNINGFFKKHSNRRLADARRSDIPPDCRESDTLPVGLVSAFLLLILGCAFLAHMWYNVQIQSNQARK